MGYYWQIINMSKEQYLKFLLIFCPVLNLLCGVFIDLYAPSLVDLSHYMSTTISMSQNTITATVLGYALGQLFFGILSQKIGNRNSVIMGLCIFSIFSAGAIFSHSIILLFI
ncbi:MAG: hypothetical protein K0R94_468, partial [Burkholderiales bacterium]|nr:hypothetical protein [Burkholderiales bacterium]